MSNEISASVSLNFGLGLAQFTISASVQADSTNANYVREVSLVTQTDSTLDIGSVASIGWVSFQNIGTAPAIQSVTGITSTGTAALVVSPNHGFSNGNIVIISGASQSQYNGTFTITGIVDANTFTYTIPSSATSPATGTISAILATNYIQIGSDGSSYPIQLFAGEPALMRWNGPAIHVKSYSQAVNIQYAVIPN